jgi:isopenicillin-N N-acyltransferase like protein
MKRWRRWRRRLLWGLGGLVITGLLGYAVLAALLRHWVARPPPLPPRAAAVLSLRPETRGDRVWLGQNWLGRRDGLRVLYLAGTPFEMGYANGVLTQDLIHRQERVVLELFRKAAPSRWTRFLLEVVIVYKNRHLREFVTPAHQMEMLGLCAGCPDAHPELGPYFNRILNFHGAQDISYMLMNSPLLHWGCTAFGAWGSRTRDGHLLTGRNFDWEAAPVFDEDRIMILCEPDEGIPFVSLGWAGLAGCVSGLNREGVSVTVNGAPSRLPQDVGTPTCLVARDVLQHARSLDEATAIIREGRVFVSALFLVGSRSAGRFVVVEKTPDTTVVRDTPDADSIVCANHYLTPELTNDPINQLFLQSDTSGARYDRAAELLERVSGTLDPPAIAELLRDRRLLGDLPAGNGHRGALNPLIATHAVIMDLTDGIFWAASPPHQLGRFVPFDVNRFDRELPARTIAEDPLLASGEYQRFLSSQAELDEGWRKLKVGEAAAALACADTADKANPGFYRCAWLRAEALLVLGRRLEATEAGRAALAGQPAMAHEREKIETVLAKARAPIPGAMSPSASAETGGRR